MRKRPNELPALSTLAVFEAVARHMSVKHAAGELNVTPGAVSRRIRTLEAELGTALFSRVHRGVVLTVAGAECYGVLSRALADIGTVFRNVRDSRGPCNVTLATTIAFAAMWLMPRLGQFWRDHPQIAINHFISESSADLRRADIDLRIRYGGGVWPGETSVKLFGDRIFPVCSPVFAEKSALRAAPDLLRTRLLKLEGVDPGWTTWEQFLGNLGLPVNGPLSGRSFNNYIVAIQAAVDSQGVALGWESLVRAHIEQRSLQRVTDAELAAPSAFYVTWATNGSLKAEAAVLRDWLIARAVVRGPTASIEPQ
jgi:LysR family transcriptional regulator, glycine cleavage system transcriptional activator